MQPLNLVIQGRYWDSHIYRGRLYLFGLDGDIRTINWDGLIGSWTIPEELRLPLDCAFRRSDFLYGADLQSLFLDQEVKDLVKSKFVRLSEVPLEVDERQLQRYEIGRQDNPCPFPHSDSELYGRSLYVVGPSGVTRASASGRTKYPVSTRAERVWDAPVLRLAASWGTLALAAGSEGMFELGLDRYYWSPDRYRDPVQVTGDQCTDCNWTFHSIFGSTQDGGFLAHYERNGDLFAATESPGRHFQEIIRAEDLWGERGYAWGVQDKLCMASAAGIRVIRYQPWGNGDRIQHLGTARTRPWKGSVLSASVAPFGVVVELENALVVYPSRGRAVTLRGEPVNWRVFPRAKHYENQLHVVWDDRLEILSFNQDYLVDQESKLLGVAVRGASPHAL